MSCESVIGEVNVIVPLSKVNVGSNVGLPATTSPPLPNANFAPTKHGAGEHVLTAHEDDGASAVTVPATVEVPLVRVTSAPAPR